MVANKPRLVIAGPGAGKTYSMVEEIIRVIPDLKTNKSLAAITFTKAATHTIQQRIKNQIDTPHNVFIGTNDSFYIKFIIAPFASLCYPDIAIEKIYPEIELDDLVSKSINNYSSKDGALYYATKNRIKNNMWESFKNKGIIPICQVASLATQILKEYPQVCSALCNQLQYVFIDEYQDIDKDQHDIFEFIRKDKKTNIYYVGDPEQYIYSFMYIKSSRGKPSFDKIPINLINNSKITDKTIKQDNRRSCKRIVEFLNNFHSEICQQPFNNDNDLSEVLFINSNNIDEIILSFQQRCEAIQKTWVEKEKYPRFLYLAHYRRVFEECAQTHQLEELEEGNSENVNTITIALSLINTLLDSSSSKIQDEYGISWIEYRKIGIQLLNNLRLGIITSIEDVIHFLRSKLSTTVNVEISRIELANKNLTNLITLITTNRLPNKRHQYSTIHKAKGLEGDAVLAIAETDSELNAWLETDKKKRSENDSDRCRIGFVAFSRAKTLLCIACIKKVSKGTYNRLAELNVKFIPDDPQSVEYRDLPLFQNF